MGFMIVTPTNTAPPALLTANLPAAASSVGQIYTVTDALLPSLGLAVAGGGAVSVIVKSNGTGWIVGG